MKNIKCFFIAFSLFLGITSSAKENSLVTKHANENEVILTKDNTLVMNDYFDGDTVAIVEQHAKDLDSKIPAGEPLYLVIDSGGGSIEAGIELIENLNNLNRPVKTVTLFSASMGFQTVQGVKGSRLVTKDGTLMSHRAKGMFFGEFPGQLDSRYAHYLKRVGRLDKQDVERTNGKFNAKSYADIIRDEMWCDGEDCVNMGFADKVVSVSCDQSLKGQHNRMVERFIYMGHTIEIVEELSNCPTITSPLNWNIIVDGEPLFSNDIDSLLKPKVVNSSGLFSSYSYNESAIKTLSLETAENIKRLVSEKIKETNSYSKRVIRYY